MRFMFISESKQVTQGQVCQLLSYSFIAARQHISESSHYAQDTRKLLTPMTTHHQRQFPVVLVTGLLRLQM